MTLTRTTHYDNVLKHALQAAYVKHGQVNFVGTEHLLYGILEESSGLAFHILINLDVNIEKMLLAVKELLVPSIRDTKAVTWKYTLSAARVFEYAEDEAKKLQHNYMGTEHLLLGLLHEDNLAAYILNQFDVTPDKVRESALFLLGQSNNKPSQCAVEELLDAMEERCEAAEKTEAKCDPPAVNEVDERIENIIIDEARKVLRDYGRCTVIYRSNNGITVKDFDSFETDDYIVLAKRLAHKYITAKDDVEAFATRCERLRERCTKYQDRYNKVDREVCSKNKELLQLRLRLQERDKFIEELEKTIRPCNDMSKLKSKVGFILGHLSALYAELLSEIETEPST